MAKKRAKAKKKVKAKKKATTKKPFGGYSISFKGRTETLEKVFGSAPIGPSVPRRGAACGPGGRGLQGTPGQRGRR